MPAETLRIVVDTNVIVSATMSYIRGRESPETRCARSDHGQGSDAALIGLLSDAIHVEYARVLHYPKFQFDPALVDEWLENVEELGLWVDPSTRVTLADSNDEKFMECAIDGGADYLITGNLKDFPPAPWIVNARQFLEEVFPS